MPAPDASLPQKKVVLQRGSFNVAAPTGTAGVKLLEGSFGATPPRCNSAAGICLLEGGVAP